MHHELKPVDALKCLNFCNWQLHSSQKSMTVFNRFHLLGYMNDQNYRTGSLTNPNTYVETLLHFQKIGVYCVISQKRVVDPIFFDDTENADQYAEIM